MKEATYNLFLYVEGTSIKSLGVAIHELDGSDADKLATLRSRVESDHNTAKRFTLVTPSEWSNYESYMRLGRQLECFEEVFKYYGAPINPLIVITPVVDGKPKILASIPLGKLTRNSLKGTPLEESGSQVDYLEKYLVNGRFEMSLLLHDDHFTAIKLLINNRYYVSAAKLLMSFIDTVSYIDLGDSPNGFASWLNSYADLNSLNITANELWEFRNGLLHMTNLSSRAVAKGKTAALSLYVGGMKDSLPPLLEGAKHLHLRHLIDVIAVALSKWVDTYNDPHKLISFVRRYDLTVSDSRLLYLSIDEST